MSLVCANKQCEMVERQVPYFSTRTKSLTDDKHYITHTRARPPARTHCALQLIDCCCCCGRRVSEPTFARHRRLGDATSFVGRWFLSCYHHSLSELESGIDTSTSLIQATAGSSPRDVLHIFFTPFTHSPTDATTRQDQLSLNSTRTDFPAIVLNDR